MENQIDPVLLPAGKSFLQKPIFWLVVFLVLVLAGSLYFYRFTQVEEEANQNSEWIKRQLAELELQKQKVGYEPFTEEDLKSQVEDLEEQKKAVGYEPFTEEEIKTQIEQLEKLKKDINN